MDRKRGDSKRDPPYSRAPLDPMGSLPLLIGIPEYMAKLDSRFSAIESLIDAAGNHDVVTDPSALVEHIYYLIVCLFYPLPKCDFVLFIYLDRD